MNLRKRRPRTLYRRTKPPSDSALAIDCLRTFRPRRRCSDAFACAAASQSFPQLISPNRSASTAPSSGDALSAAARPW